MSSYPHFTFLFKNKIILIPTNKYLSRDKHTHTILAPRRLKHCEFKVSLRLKTRNDWRYSLVIDDFGFDS